MTGQEDEDQEYRFIDALIFVAMITALFSLGFCFDSCAARFL